MTLHNPLLLIALMLWSMSSNAEDCLVKTDTRSLMTGMAGLQEEKINVAEGRYTAVLKNGDVVLARFATCDLGMQANYLSVKALDNAELRQTLEMFLTRALASDAVAKKVMPQIKALSAAALQKTATLQGLNDQHQIVVKPAASPNFHTIIQYNWIPPEY
jgi:redox-regulated HSP33 family molecular chaperone